MATTTKTLTPTNQTITLPDMTERPNASVLVDGIGKDADAINALSTKTNGTIAKHSGVSGGTLDCATLYKVGNTVFASGRIHSLDNVPTNQPFFQIPAGFRPATNTYVMGYANLMHGSDLGARPLFMHVKADGTVNCSYSVTATLTQIFFSGSWSII